MQLMLEDRPEFLAENRAAVGRQQADRSGWWFTTWRSPATGGWQALAKRGPFVDGGPLSEPGELWFDFGSGAADALANLKRGLAH